MKLVATSDTHEVIKKELIPDGDVLIVAGDFMYTGYEDEWYPRIEAIAKLPHKVKLLVGGNHDRHLELYPGPACQELKKLGITVVGKPLEEGKHVYKLENGMTVLGLPFVTGLPRWSFNWYENSILEYLEKIGRCDIVVSHSPPRGILDGGRGAHYGIVAYRHYLKRFQPKIWISGHIHSSYGTVTVEGCEMHNVAMCNEAYEQVNPAHVIEV